MNKQFIFIFLFIFLWIRGIVFLDPDFGWRLKTGNLIIGEGVPITDPYTYTMPSYPWVNHAWFTDLSIAVLYPYIGVIGLAAIFSLIVVISINFTLSLTNVLLARKNNIARIKSQDVIYLAVPILLLVSASFFRFTGIRAQAWTWFFVSILIRLLLDVRLWSKFRIFTPLIFIMWVNLHGGFAAGLAILVFVLGLKWIKTKKIDYLDFVVVLLSVLATFLNPFGKEIYREVWLTLTSSGDHKEILEWNSALKSFDVPFLILVAFSASTIFYLRKKLPIELSLLFLAFLIQAFLAVRQIPLWALVTMPICVVSVYEFRKSLGKNKISLKRFGNIYNGFYIFALAAFIIEMILTFQGAVHYSEEEFYPREAVSYLKHKIPKGELFSKYDWGGYLIWKYPEKKVFIDGRMPFWEWNKNIDGETDNALKDFLDITRGDESYKGYFEKYGVDTVLWSASKYKDPFETLDDKFREKFSLLYRLLGIEKKEFEFIKDLEKDGWAKVYEDDKSVIYTGK